MNIFQQAKKEAQFKKEQLIREQKAAKKLRDEQAVLLEVIASRPNSMYKKLRDEAAEDYKSNDLTYGQHRDLMRRLNELYLSKETE